MSPLTITHNDNLVEVLAAFSDAIVAIDTVKCFNGQALELGKFSTKVAKSTKWYLKVVNLNSQQSGFMQFMGSAMLVQGFYYGGVLVDKKQNTLSDVVTAFLAALGTFSSLAYIVPQLLVLEKGRAAGQALRAIADYEEGKGQTMTSGENDQLDERWEDIVFDKVCSLEPDQCHY